MPFLFRPIDPYSVNQPFGANETCFRKVNGKDEYITVLSGICPIGYQSLYTAVDLKGHDGIDLRAVTGQVVFCAFGGTVCRVSTDVNAGLGIEVVSLCSDGVYRKHQYWHFSRLGAFKVGDRVKTGDVLGYAGATGHAAGPHLHFGLYECDAQGNTRHTGNGYFGAIDPAPFFLDIFAPQATALTVLLAKAASWLRSLAPKPAPLPASPTPMPSKLQSWAKAIETHEGYYKGSRSYRNNNSGNIRCGSFASNCGATACDPQNFAVFPNYKTGFDALCTLLRNAASGKSSIYRPTMMLFNEKSVVATYWNAAGTVERDHIEAQDRMPGFFQLYAPAEDRNAPLAYAEAVAKAIGVPVTGQIKNLV